MGNPDDYVAGSPTSEPPGAGNVSSPEADLPVEGSARQLVTESPPSPPRARRWLIAAFVAMALVMLVTIVSLAVVLSRNNNNGNGNPDDSIGDKAPTMSPAVMADRKAAVEAWIVQEGYSSAESLAQSDSPQSRAVEFMVKSMGLDVPTESTSDKSIAWMERYVLVVFYYSLRGEQWMDQSNFLDAENSCCIWNVGLLTLANEYYEQGAFCDETFLRIKKIQFCECPRL
jgi:hypothetical protein